MPTISLPSKPSAELFYEYHPSASSDILIVFINGLVAPAAAWKPTITLLADSPHQASTLIYDRFGQGATTARDPLDAAEGKLPGLGHTYTDVVADLHELIQTISPTPSPKLLLVSNSIGVHIARLYTQKYPSHVAGALFLDSNIGNKEFHDLWPDPTADDFDPATVVSDDVTLEQYKETCQKLRVIFNSSGPTLEGLDRRNQKELLPEPDAPTLLGPDGKGIHLIVAGHDPKENAAQSWNSMRVPPSLTFRFTEPAWAAYNEGLAKLSPRATGPIIAAGAGHFIQKDQPGFVAEQIGELLARIAA